MLRRRPALGHYNFYGIQRLPEDSSFFETLVWALRNLPLSSPTVIALSLALVGIAFAAEFGIGVTLIVVGTLEVLYILVRYVIIAYRLFSKNTPAKNSVLVVLDLKFCEYLAIASIVLGMYFIDATPGKTKYFLHAGFSAGYNLYGVWLYLVAATVAVMTGTGYSSIIENSLPAATVFSFGISMSYYSTLFVLATLVSNWYDFYTEPSPSDQQQQQRIRMFRSPRGRGRTAFHTHRRPKGLHSTVKFT